MVNRSIEKGFQHPPGIVKIADKTFVQRKPVKAHPLITYLFFRRPRF